MLALPTVAELGVHVAAREVKSKRRRTRSPDIASDQRKRRKHLQVCRLQASIAKVRRVCTHNLTLQNDPHLRASPSLLKLPDAGAGPCNCTLVMRQISTCCGYMSFNENPDVKTGLDLEDP